MSDNTLAGASSFSVEQLRYLVEVAARPSFRSAANHLHLSSAALTRQMTNLEDRLGVSLFNRTNNGIRLTAAGTEVHQRAVQILREIDRLREAAHDADRAVSGVLSIACYPVHVERILGRTIGTFRRQFPHVRFDLSQMRDDRRRTWGDVLFEELRSGEVDLAMGPPHHYKGVTGMRMYDARIVALVPDGDPYRTAGSIPIRALQNRPLLMAPEGFFSRERVSTEAHAAGFEINVVAHSSSPAALLAGVS